MTSTLFASFEKPSEAEKAAGALLDHGIEPRDLSLLVHESYDQEGRTDMASADQERIRNEIEQNETTGSSIGHAVVNDFGRSTVQPEGAWPVPGSNIAYGMEMAGGVESTDAATHYPSGDVVYDTDDGAPTYNPAPGTLTAHDAITHDPSLQREPVSAKSGLTTTTAADAGVGAVKGLAVGIGVGVLASLVAVFLPGIGLVLGSGALATAIAGTAGAAGAGVIAGGVVGFLKDQGVPDDALTVYREAFDEGGAILAVAMTTDTDRPAVEAILAKYGAKNVDMYATA